MNFFPARAARHIFLMIFFFARYARSGFEWFLHPKKRSKILLRSPSARGFETAELFNFFAGCKTWVDFHTARQSGRERRRTRRGSDPHRTSAEGTPRGTLTALSMSAASKKAAMGLQTLNVAVAHQKWPAPGWM